MNLVLYRNLSNEKQNLSNEKLSEQKKTKVREKQESRPLSYPIPEENEIRSKTFHIKYEKKLSLTGKSILNNFRGKYIYYAIDDILYAFQSNPSEQENLLAILYAPVLSLQNNLSINFFDIWIANIYIEEMSNVNKFLNYEFQTSKPRSSITITFFYKIRRPAKNLRSFW